MSVKMIDIARQAGVTRQAVSAVFNHPDTCRISAAMQKKIREIASQLGYTPNIAAKILKGGASGTIGIIDNQLQYGVSTTRFKEVVTLLQQHNLNPVLSVTMSIDTIPPAVIQELEMRGVDGIMLNTIGRFPDLSECCNVPHVTFGKASDPASDFFFDSIAGGRMAAEHLYWHGRRKIAFLAHQEYFFHDCDGRSKGWHDVCSECGIPCGDDMLLFGKKFNWNFDNLAETIRKQKINAIICQNDYVGGKLISELLCRGIKVPDDIAVMGYDGLSFGEFCAVPLATIIQPVRELAISEVGLLLERIKKREINAKPLRKAISPVLSPSASCGCCTAKEESFYKLNYQQTTEMSHYTNFDEPLDLLK